MNRFPLRRSFTAAGLCILFAFARPSAAADHGLLAALPQDTVVAARSIRAEEAKFIERSWAKVWMAVEEAKVIDDTWALLIQQMQGPDRAKLTAAVDAAKAKLSTVNWADLVAREYVGAIAFNTVAIEAITADPEITQQAVLSAYLPSVALLFRVEEADLATRISELTGLLEALQALDPAKLTLTSKQHLDASWNELEIEGVVQIVVTGYGNAVIVGFNRYLAEEALIRLNGTETEKLLTTAPRFVELSEKLPTPETAFSYTDVTLLLDTLQHTVVTLAKNAPHTDDNVVPILDRIFKELRLLDRGASSTRIEANSELSEAIWVTADGWDTTILGRAMQAQQPFDDFARFVPAKAQSFSAATTFDLVILYDGVVDLIVEFEPTAKKQIADMEATIKKELGVSLREDILGWIGGEVVSVIMPNSVGLPQQAMLLRVKDEQKALDVIALALDKLQVALKQSGQQLNVGASRGKLGEADFVTVRHPMLFMAQINGIVIGTVDGWLLISPSEDLAEEVLLTMKGEKDTIAKSPRFIQEGTVAPEPAQMVAFMDLSNEGQLFAQQLGVLPLTAMMLPANDPNSATARTFFGILGKLSSAAMALDFRSSRSAAVWKDADQNYWHSRAALTYKESALKN